MSEFVFTEEAIREGQVLFIDKPLHWTSFDVVNKVRIAFRQHLGIKKIKVGHAGTLDPLATGLVILCTGRFTKKIDQFMGLEKSYLANVRLGGTTPSFDLETEIDKTYPVDHITPALLEEGLNEFKGPIQQVPPMFSALKLNGKKLYELAREGKEVELKSREVTIHKIELKEVNLPDVTLDVTCSKGTYIRSLARDYGLVLNSGGHLTGLIRTSIGPYDVKDAWSMEKFQEKLASAVTN